MKAIKLLITVVTASTLSACFAPYPDSGAIVGYEYQVEEATRGATVYSISSNDFSNWRESIKHHDFESLTLSELAEIRNTYIDSEQVLSYQSKSPYFVDKDLDEEDLFEIEKSLNQDKIQELDDKITAAKVRQTQSKAKEDEINEILLEFDKQLQELQNQDANAQSDFQTLQQTVATRFDEVQTAQTGRPSRLSRQILRKNHFVVLDAYEGFKNCQEQVTSMNKHESYQYNVYADAIDFKHKQVCPYFQLPAHSAKRKAKLFQGLTEEDKNTIRLASHAFINQQLARDYVTSEIENVKRRRENKAEELKQKNGLNTEGYEHSTTIQSSINEWLGKKGQYELLSDKELTVNMTQALRYQLEASQFYYDTSRLFDSLDKVSNVQPDGRFELDGSEKFHLIIARHNYDNKFYSLVRMDEFEGEDKVIVNIKYAFDYHKLKQLKL
ncbi:hypothetical protein SOPP22_19260 [Shewanella sp. OPT22]|nr:hypothetical protein SOPP22_19260 [Shewanella sp. OPT22]